MKRILILALGLCCAAAPARAAAKKPAPLVYEGVWASPDCGNDGVTLMFTRNYLLKSTEVSTVFSPADLSASGRDYGVATFEGAAHPVMRTEDGILAVGVTDAPVAAWPDTWDALSLAGHSEYAHCAAIPAVVPVPLARAMQKIEAVRAACGASVTAACRKLLFTLADINGNRRLSLSEFKKTGAMLGTFLPLLDGKPVLTSELEAGYTQGIVDGARVAEAALAARDADASGDLNEKEMADFPAGLDDSALHRAAQKLAILFAGFKDD